MKKNRHSICDRIDIWTISLSAHQTEAESCRALLSEQEATRAEKFNRPEDRLHFVLCRGLLRRILADYLETDPTTLVFEKNENGKPFLQDRALDFNVSHSHDRLLIAVTKGRAVGVDIERHRSGVRMEAIARRWFSAEEQNCFRSLKDPAAGFFMIWAKKEAYVKALGQGIYKELNRFSVPTGNAPDAPQTGSDPHWFFQSLEIDPSYAAAVVSEAPPVPVGLRSLGS